MSGRFTAPIVRHRRDALTALFLADGLFETTVHDHGVLVSAARVARAGGHFADHDETGALESQ